MELIIAPTSSSLMRIICRACVKGWTQRQTEDVSSAEKAGYMLAVTRLLSLFLVVMVGLIPVQEKLL